MSDKRVIRVPGAQRLRLTGLEVVSVEVVSGFVLLVATVAALVIANVAPGLYDDFWHSSLRIGVGDLAIEEDLRHWLNDGLMAIFFFVVGLEIKREFVLGDLADRRAAALPVAGAVGGMIVPAAIFVAINLGGEGIDGWATPMATDIAFALAVLSVVGSKSPPGLKLFLLTLAIADDIGAIAVIAFFYSEGIAPGWLLAAGMTIGAMVAMRRAGLAHPGWYVLPAVVLWVCTLESGVHATIAGVVLGLLTPTGAFHGRPVLTDLETRLLPWTSFLIVPVFALANAGVVLDADSIEAAATGAVAWGVTLGLVIGKPVGILAATALALRFGIGMLPPGVKFQHLVGVSMIAGIGFTVALFVADLSFEGALLGEAKVAVLTASTIAAVAGSLIVRATVPEGKD